MYADSNESKDKRNKETKMKVSQFINTIFSKKTSKLRTDAAVVPDEPNSSLTPTPLSSSPSRMESFASWTSTRSINTENNVVAEVNDENRQLSNATSSAINNNPMLGYSCNNMNNAMTVNNFESQNNYNFSHVNGLTFGSIAIYKIGENDSKQKQPERKVSTNESIDSESNNGAEALPESPNKPYKKLKTKSISVMMKSNDELDYAAMKIVSEHLGEGWRFCFRELGFSEGQIQQMYEGHREKGIKEVIYQLLLDWQRNAEDPTIGRLSTILWEQNQRECVSKLKDYWKPMQRLNGNNEKPNDIQ